MRLDYTQREALLDARSGLVHLGGVSFHECARRLHRALPTLSHARQLVEAVLARLGDHGRLDPYTDGTKAMVLRADPEGWWMRRSPVALFEGAEQNECDQLSEVPLTARPADAPPGWSPGDPAFRPTDPVPDIVPAGLGRAVLTLWTGDAVVELRYGATGLAEPDRALFRFGDRWAERRFAGLWPPTIDPAARPPQAPPPTWFLDVPEELSIDDLAERILSADAALDPVRVRMNVDAPGGVEGCWFRARMALRKLAMDEVLPGVGGVYVLDAYEHPPEETCLATGPDLAQAEAAWLAEERRLRPRWTRRVDEPELEPPPADPPAPDETETTTADGRTIRTFSTGMVRLTVQPVTVIPWPIPGPRTTPAVAVRVPPLRTEIPAAWAAEGFTRWRYVIGDSGRVGFMLVRDEPDGFTLVGDGAVDLVDPVGLEEALAAATAAEDPFPFPEPPWLRYPYEHRHYSVWSDLLQARTPPTAAGGSWNLEWNWRDLDADLYRWRVTRMRLRNP